MTSNHKSLLTGVFLLPCETQHYVHR